MDFTNQSFRTLFGTTTHWPSHSRLACPTIRMSRRQHAGNVKYIANSTAYCHRKTVPRRHSCARAVIYRQLVIIGWILALIIGVLGAASAEAEVLDCYRLWGANEKSRAQLRYWGDWTTMDGSVTTETPCELYEPASSSLSGEFGVDIRIYLPVGFDVHPHPDAPRDTAALVAEAVGETLRTFRPRFEPFDINIALLQNVPVVRESPETSEDPDIDSFDWNTMAEANGSSYRGCWVSLYINALLNNLEEGGTRTAAPRDLQSTIAHEIFHCYQQIYYPAQNNGSADEKEDGWWTEATADFAADMVYPCADETARHARAYKPEERINLQDFPYSVVTFYMHLRNSHGFDLSALADFMGGMATNPGFQAQYDALAAQPDIAAKFHEFAKAYTDGDIPCAGEVTGFMRIPTPVTASPGTEIPLDIAPFRFAPVIATVEKGKQVRVRLVNAGDNGADRTTSYRLRHESGADAWRTLSGSALLTGGCDDKKDYVFLSTVYGNDDTVSDSRLVFEGPGSEVPFEEACGECPVGAWRLDIDHTNKVVQSRAVQTHIGGAMDLWLYRNGVAKVDYYDFTAFTSEIINSTYNGTTTGKWEHVGPFELLPGGRKLDIIIPEGIGTDVGQRIRERLRGAAGKDRAMTIRWTRKDVTRTKPNPGYPVAESLGLPPPLHQPRTTVNKGQRGPYAPTGRHIYTCKDNNQLDIAGLRFWRFGIHPTEDSTQGPEKQPPEDSMQGSEMHPPEKAMPFPGQSGEP